MKTITETDVRTGYYKDRRFIYHCDDGPANIQSDGSKYWYKHGKLHRLDGPAFENSSGLQWWVNGNLHRLDGPAIEYANGAETWYFEGERFHCNSQQEFERLIKLKALW